MVSTYRFTGYALVLLGLILLTLDFVIHLKSSTFSLFCLILGQIFISGGLVSFYQNYKQVRSLETQTKQAQDAKLETKQKLLEEIQQKIAHLQRIIDDIEKSGTYLVCDKKIEALNEIESINYFLQRHPKISFIEQKFLNNIQNLLTTAKQNIQNYNQHFIEERKKQYQHLWRIDDILLDDEQQTAIVTDDTHNLVVAAAGSGKTEVLITRIHYLIERKPDGVQPNKILAIAYQNKDVKQIKRRLEKHGIDGVHIKTFHSLGLEILEKAGSLNNNLEDRERKELIRRIYENELKNNRDFYKKFLSYIKSIHETNIISDFTDEVNTIEINKSLPYTALNDEAVKSRAEKEIYDFLLTNKLNNKPIKVEYEKKIEIEVEGEIQTKKPDFYLPEYDLYIEHWGLTKNGQVPKWFDQSTEEYLKNKEVKKNWFNKNNKLFVETFSHEYDESNPQSFLNNLQNKIVSILQERNSSQFNFEMMNYQELIDSIITSDDGWGSIEGIPRDLANFIKNAKTYNLTPERIKQKLETGNWSPKQRAFAKLAIPIFELYEKKLQEIQKIDFEDMINKAISELNHNTELCKNQYEHILVDEYQDITQQTNNLIKALLSNNKACKLFCVGDDWQSIMGFAGSNLDFFVNFEKHYKNPAITKISTNYRSAKMIVDAGTCLIKNNGDCQRKKVVLSKNDGGRPIRLLCSPHRLNYKRKYISQITQDCMKRVEDYLKQGYTPKDILILNRFMLIHGNQMPRYHYVIENLISEAKKRGIKITDNARDDRRIRILTVHKAKGLEAKVVFILNMIKDTFGFPSEIEDNSILEIARENYPKQDKKAEERRLFYVALSRAREELNIYTWEPATSEFLDEIKEYTVEVPLNY